MGRPPHTLIQNPAMARVAAEGRLKEAERKARDRWIRGVPSCPPRRSDDPLEQGLILANRSKYISDRSVKAILAEARAFQAWLADHKGRSGPAPDTTDADWLFATIKMANRIIKKRKLPHKEPSARGLAEVWHFLRGEPKDGRYLHAKLRKLKPKIVLFRERTRKSSAAATGAGCPTGCGGTDA